jgi:putative CocE/NonD family hydrolase
MIRSSQSGFLVLALLASLTVQAAAPSTQVQLPANAAVGDYVGTDVMIPMRDGIKLHAQVWRPRGAAGKLPILMQRSPYGFALEQVTHSFEGPLKELAQEKFIFVLEDIRGRFGSEGDFVMLRPQATRADGIDESTDTYDSIDWLVKSLPNNNGNAGVFGISYGGWTAAMATVNPHPALKAVSVQASPEDMFLGDDFHHNGAFRLSYGWEYAVALETDGRTLNAFDFHKEDPYSWFLKQDDLATLDRRALGRTLPTWQEFVAHPNYDNYWRMGLTSVRMPAKVKVPNLIVAGWWDQEDFYGPLTIYSRQEKGDAEHRNFIVIGPWNHGGWARSNGGSYGPFDLGSDTSVYFRAQVQTPWFKYWLKQEGALKQPEALVFETGSNRWQSYDVWPPRNGVTPKKLYLQGKRALSWDPPKATGDAAADRFISDPANPVPYRQRPIQMLMDEKSTWPVWLADDQAPFASRADVLSWQTPPLDEDVTIRGDVAAKLYASTTGSDADWIVKLIDVYPGGRQLMIANEVFRGRFRTDFEHPQPLTPGKVLPYSIDMHSASHVFKKGHRIAVQVQSTWFPLIDRNPQVFQPNIFKAKRSEFKAQTHSVYRSAEYPSAIEVSVAR